MNALNLAPQERDEIARRVSAGCAACFSVTLIILIRSSIRDRPLELFYSISDLLVPKVDFESIHPLVGTEVNRLHLLLQLLWVCDFARPRQTADDDECRPAMAFACHLERFQS